MNSIRKKGFEVCDIFNNSFWNAHEKYNFTLRQMEVSTHIMACRTNQMRGFIYYCKKCNRKVISYCSCRDRMCPKCQSESHHNWINKMEKVVLDCVHLHAVVTVPSVLNKIALANKETFYTLMFKTAIEAILTLCKDPKHLGAMPGITAILHTWGQKIDFHPHIHMAVTAGGLNDEGKWVDARRTKKGDVYLFPVKALSSMVKQIFLKKLRLAKKKGRIEFDDEEFTALLKESDKKDWISYVKEPFKGSKGVFAYIGNYTHRSVISNSRLVDVTDTHTTFKYRDYADDNKQKMLTLENEEFIRRFLVHTLKSGFVRIRHYGLYAVPNRKEKLANARRQTSCTEPPIVEDMKVEKKEEDESKEDTSSLKCPYCGELMRRITKKPLTRKGMLKLYPDLALILVPH